MQNKCNEEIFDAVLQRAFFDYVKDELNSYPDNEALAEMYPLPKKEKRAFDRAAKEVKYKKSLVKVYLSRAAVIFLCVIALSAGAMMFSPTVRAALKNVIVEWFDKYALFTFVSTETGDDDFESIEDVEIGYIPEGSVLVNNYEIPEQERMYNYSLNDSDVYMIDIFLNEISDISIDNERSQYTKTTINGHEALVVYDEENKIGDVILVGSKISVLITGDLPKDELIKIAESIK